MLLGGKGQTTTFGGPTLKRISDHYVAKAASACSTFFEGRDFYSAASRSLRRR